MELTKLAVHSTFLLLYYVQYNFPSHNIGLETYPDRQAIRHGTTSRDVVD